MRQKFIDPQTGRVLGTLRAPLTPNAWRAIRAHGISTCILAFELAAYYNKKACDVSKMLSIPLSFAYPCAEAGRQILIKVDPSGKSHQKTMIHKVTITFNDEATALETLAICQLGIRAGALGAEAGAQLIQCLPSATCAEMASFGTLGEIQEKDATAGRSI